MKKSIVMMVVALITSLLVGMGTTTAHAADAPLDGCHGRYVKKVDVWPTNHKKIAFGFTRFAHQVRMGFTPDAIYWYCPNRARADKIKPLAYNFCTYFPDGKRSIPEEPTAYQGTKWNVFASDSKYESNPPAIEKRNNNAEQQCVLQYVPNSQRKWLVLVNNPEWQVHVTVERENMKDAQFFMRDTTSAYTPQWKEFHPSQDLNVTRWYRP